MTFSCLLLADDKPCFQQTTISRTARQASQGLPLIRQDAPRANYSQVSCSGCYNYASTALHFLLFFLRIALARFLSFSFVIILNFAVFSSPVSIHSPFPFLRKHVLLSFLLFFSTFNFSLPFLSISAEVYFF